MLSWFTRRFVLSGLVALGLASLTFVACKTQAEIGINNRIPIPGGGEVIIKGTLGVSGGRGSAENTSTRCFQVKFYDAHGQVLGSSTIRPGANADSVPAGATSYTAVEIPCPPPASPPSGGMVEDGTTASLATSEVVTDFRGTGSGTRPLVDLAVFGAPLYIDRSSTTNNATYSFVVRCVNADAAFAIVRNALDDPIGASIDPAITIVMYMKVRENAISASVIGIARQPFIRFDLDVNRQDDYATLSVGAVQSVSAAGIHVVDAPVSLLDIHGYDEWNQLVVRSQHGGNVGVETTSVSMIHNR